VTPRRSPPRLSPGGQVLSQRYVRAVQHGRKEDRQRREVGLVDHDGGDGGAIEVVDAATRPATSGTPSS
jgi:hypothetical protein